MKKYITISMLLFYTTTVFAQDDKMPTQAEMQKMMKDGQKELDNLDTETKRMMDSMGIKMPDMKASEKIMSGVDQAQLQKEWNRQTLTVPAKDAARIAAIATTPSTNNISAYIKSSQSKLFAHLKADVKTVGDKLYASFKSSGKTTQEMGSAAAGLWMTGKTEIACYILSKACADDASNVNNISNYTAMLSMGGYEEMAIPLLNNLNARFPKNSIIFNNLGQAWFGLGDISKAGNYLDSTLRFPGAHSQATLTKAKIAESKGNKTEAVELVKKSIKEAYSQEKNAYLKKLGYTLKAGNVQLSSLNKPDPLNLGSFQPPAFPKSVTECILLGQEWNAFKQMLDGEAARLGKELAEASKAILPASKSRRSSGQRITPIHVDVANLKLAEVKETYDRKLQAWGMKVKNFVEGRGKQLKDDYEAEMDKLREENLEQTGEGKANEDYCPKYREASSKFLSAYNTEMERLYKEVLLFHKIFYNETGYYSVYALWPEELKAELASLKAGWLGVLKESAVFQSITQYMCVPPDAKPGTGKLAKFDDVACQYHSEMNLIVGSIKMDCSSMYTEMDLNMVKLGLTQDMDKEGFGEQFVSGTVEITAGVGKAEIGEIEAGVEVGGGLGIEIDRSGVSDVYVIGKAEIGAEVGTISTSKGFEGKVSLVSGAYSGGFE